MASEADIKKALTLLESLLNISHGKEFDRLTSSNTPTNNDKTYYALYAANDSSADLGGGTTVVNDGDSPAASDTIPAGVTIFGEFKEVEISTGTVYAYYRT